MTKTKRHKENDRRRIQRDGLLAAWRGVELGDPIGHGNPAVYVWLRQHDAFLRTELGKGVVNFVVWHVARDKLHDPAIRRTVRDMAKEWVDLNDEAEITTWYLRRALTDPSLGMLDPGNANAALTKFIWRLLDELCRIVDGPSFTESLQRKV